MKAKLSAIQAFSLYGLVLGFIFLFYVSGLFMGRNYFLPAAQSNENTPVNSVPVPDVKPDLDNLNQLIAPPQGQSQLKEPTDESGQTANVETEPPAPTEIFTIQVIATISEPEARQTLLRLEAKGFSSRLVEPAPGKDRYYRVEVGEFAVMVEAQEMEARLKESGFPTFIKKTRLPEVSRKTRP